MALDDHEKATILEKRGTSRPRPKSIQWVIVELVAARLSCDHRLSYTGDKCLNDGCNV